MNDRQGLGGPFVVSGEPSETRGCSRVSLIDIGQPHMVSGWPDVSGIRSTSTESGFDTVEAGSSALGLPYFSKIYQLQLVFSVLLGEGVQNLPLRRVPDRSKTGRPFAVC